MIEYKNITKAYGDKEILKDFSLKIEEGDFLTIVGRSGSGKTTLLKMVNGLVKPDQGQVLVKGQGIEGQDLIQLRRQIGYAIQGNVLFPHMTVAENIAYVLWLQGQKEEQIAAIVEQKLAMLDLEADLKDRYPAELSGGQAQRVGIARSLGANPSILLMDEPFGAVDAITRYQLQRELKKLYQTNQMTVVFITHDITEALKLGSKVLVLDNGQIQQFASPMEIQQQPANDFVRDLLDIAGVSK
ncbi:ATP-binding cassette domain-containing protein [Streptococcus panodentis]|uniref:Glycine/betaine ABC transporter ATP-binding protein n=1 Tax=Streptococcus panodentis TaxID=1581472 RepID=A0ABS5B198_9STRE|nr:ABC transporter ATP-binding protein [Streptococcus panodentis]MBP2621754.1 glycine/betaine ABC transporter ATP-binding protein [Streptococcus panodentis]